ncbi:MAG TPA: toll/interleukin-1 receptor domain-containing protein, partial [Planctomycetota bacterium]|nr:toll/interleukin-1 receptor domain-containing protein [Planctomycetota bacterium]
QNPGDGNHAMIRKPKNTKRVQVFLSYARVDQSKARKLHNLLALANAEIYTLDTFSLTEDAVAESADKIAQCDIFMLILSPASTESGNIFLELGAAWALNKPVIAVATQPEVTTIPDAMGPAQIIGIDEIEKPGVLKGIIDRFAKPKKNAIARTRRNVKSREAV